MSRQNNFYYRFEADSTYKRVEVDSTAVAGLVNAELIASGNSSSTYGMVAIGNIPCYFKSTSNKDKFYFAISFYGTYNPSASSYVNKSFIVSALRPSANATTLSVSRYTTSSLCANTWNASVPFQVINGI